MPHSNFSANETAIAEIVAKLLNHYGTVDEPLAVRRSIARDWLEDLAEFTPGQVAWAAREWRRTQSMRPTIADIRTLCARAQHAELERRAIAENTRRGLDQETIDMWERPEYEGDTRTWEERRCDAAKKLQDRFARADQWRRDNPDWRDKRPAVGIDVVRAAARALGVTATQVKEEVT